MKSDLKPNAKYRVKFPDGLGNIRYGDATTDAEGKIDRITHRTRRGFCSIVPIWATIIREG